MNIDLISGKIVVKPRTASVPADKLHPVEYFVTVPARVPDCRA